MVRVFHLLQSVQLNPVGGVSLAGIVRANLESYDRVQFPG